MKVLFCYRVPLIVQEHFRNRLPNNIELIFPPRIEESSLVNLAQDVDILIGYKFSEELILSAKKLKHIQVPWTGSESLDFNLLKKFPNITVSNSHSNALVIAEHAIALFLATAKLIVSSDRKMRKGDWSSRYNDENSYLLYQKNLGVIGFGAIGINVAKILKAAFNMKILAIKRFPEKINPKIEYDYLGGYEKEDLEHLLKQSDFILIALPLTEETRNLIGKDEFKLMKPNTIIVNISRGPIINEEALFNSLKKKKIAGAGLDVWYNYPKDRKNPVNVFQNFPFRDLDNVVLSPHRAFKVHERGDIVSAQDVIDNIILISERNKPKNQLNLELGY
ncbi:MAG: 2-hydroxyacid dehydrogenase [Candidatus Hodarchaeota archaeon]